MLATIPSSYMVVLGLFPALYWPVHFETWLQLFTDRGSPFLSWYFKDCQGGWCIMWQTLESTTQRSQLTSHWDTVVNCQRYKVGSNVKLLGLFQALLKLSDRLLLFERAVLAAREHCDLPCLRYKQALHFLQRLAGRWSRSTSSITSPAAGNPHVAGLVSTTGGWAQRA